MSELDLPPKLPHHQKSYSKHLDSCGIFKNAVLAILAVIAKQERVQLSERTIAGQGAGQWEGRD
jgi:hypothetical protein